MSQQPAIRNFCEALTAMEDGQLVEDLAEKLNELIAEMNNAAIDNGGKQKGSLTLKLDFTLDGGLIETNANVKSTLPTIKRQRSVFWSTPDNYLSRNNPKQRDIFEDVNKERAVRSV